MLRIVIDGAGDLADHWGDEYDIQVIPINIHFGERMYLQKVDLSNADFYRLVSETRTVPKTSQPTPNQFVKFYETIAQPGDTILSIHVTSKLSGTYESAVLAAKEVSNKFKVLPFDSASGSAAIGYLAREARIMERSGEQIDMIMKHLEAMRARMTIILTLDTLEYARMSGRVKTLQAALASLLNVKPIVILQDGILDMADRVRTRRRALDYILDATVAKVGDSPVFAAVVHAQDPGAGEELMGRVRGMLNCRDLVMTELSISVAANLGPGTVGIVTIPV